MPETIPASARIREYKLMPSFLLGTFRSLDGTEVFHELNAGKTDRWVGTYTFVPALGSDLRELTGWLMRLGRTGTFYAYDPLLRTPKNGPVSATVSGTGKTLSISGGGTLVPGDYIQVGTQYFIVTSAPSGGSIGVWPAARGTFSNATVISTNPVMVARLMAPAHQWGTREAEPVEITVPFEEVF